jgi:hypothetical protein
MPGRHIQSDSNPKRPASTLVLLRRFHCDSATDNVLAYLFQSRCFISNKLLKKVGFVNTSEGNFQWNFHKFNPPVVDWLWYEPSALKMQDFLGPAF